MASNYNTIRTMKGMAVGTIIPWSGDISGTGGIPKGWLPCVGGRTYRISDYPDLYEVIGNRYGGSQSDGTFFLPNITSKSLTDYHPSHSNVSNIGYSGNFSSYLGNNNDVANQNIVSQSSNIDLFVSFDNNAASGLKATTIGHNINSSTYSDTVGVVERRLGDAHISTHSHEAVLPSVRTTNAFSERCQNNITAGGIGLCQDVCSERDYYRSTNASNQEDDLVVPKYEGGEHVGCGRKPYGTQGYKMERRDEPDLNYLTPDDDTVLHNDVLQSSGCQSTNDCGNTIRGIYGTTLSTNIANFQNSSMTGHNHRDILHTINTGNVTTKEIVNINNIYTSISPTNNQTKDVMSIEVNVATASLQMMYIIKAY